MTTNITTLALNLLISERLNHRSIFADRIIELVQKSNETSAMELELKNSFLALTSNCVEDPNCEGRDVFYKLAQYYNQKINGTHEKLTAAA